MNKALLDTDILSEVIKGIDPVVARNAGAYRRAFGRYTLSSITVLEVVRGLRRVQSPRRISAFLKMIRAEEVLAFDSDAGRVAGEIVGELERTGRPIGFADPMIAALALTRDLDLVTGNIAHFDRIRQLGYPLVLTNWRT